MRGGTSEHEIRVAEEYEEIPPHPQQSTVVTQLIRYNESKMCDALTNATFLLLTLLLLGCLGFVIAFCLYPKTFGFEFIDKQYQQYNIDELSKMMRMIRKIRKGSKIPHQ